MIHLEQKEKDRFLAWLAQEIKSEQEIIELLEKVGGGHEAKIKKTHSRILAYGIVAEELFSRETMTMGGDDGTQS